LLYLNVICRFGFQYMNLNKVFLIGNLTRDPEQKTMPNGRSISSFGMATNRIWTDKESGEKQQQVEFHNLVAFGKLADICNQYLTKGKLVFIEGRLQTRSWDDQSGNKKFRTEIIIESMQMGPKLSGEVSKASSMPEEPEEAPIEKEDKPTKKSSKSSSPKAAKDEEEINVEDIPF